MLLPIQVYILWKCGEVIMSTFQLFHFLHTDVTILIDKQTVVNTLNSKILSNTIELNEGIHDLQIRNYQSNELIYSGKFPIFKHQQIIVFLLTNKQCISILKSKILHSDESVLRFFNLLNSPTNLHLSVTKGDHLIENISFGQLSEPLQIFPMTIDLEVRIANNVIKKIPKVVFKPNCSYIILIDNTKEINILEI